MSTIQEAAQARIDLHEECMRFNMMAPPPPRTRSGEAWELHQSLSLWHRFLGRFMPLALARRICGDNS